MKQILYSFFFASLLFLSWSSRAQSPAAFSYQAVVRNASGALVQNQPILLRLRILNNNDSGTVLYKEVHTVTPNAYGLVNVAVGKGSPVLGSFNAIPGC
jgi:hypothetical protein